MTAETSAPLAEEGPHVALDFWPHGPRSAGKARRALARCLNAWGMARLTDTAELVVAELMANAIIHAREPRGRLIGTRFERLASGVRIEVHDAGDTKPERREPTAADESGRGLALVDVLTGGHWGVSGRDGVGKVVWAVCAEELKGD